MEKLYKKLYDIQEENNVFKKDADNPFFKSKYLSLEGLMEDLRPILTKHKLLVLHQTMNREVVTKVFDTENNAGVGSSFPLPEDLTPQKLGSAITYAKRYNLSQIFNIITDTDDDGNKASAKPAKKTTNNKDTELDF